MQFLNILKIVLELVPALIVAIKAIEDAIPGQGAGEQKLAMVRAFIESTYKSTKDLSVTFEQLWPVIESTIKTLVNGFNSVGVFKK